MPLFSNGNVNDEPVWLCCCAFLSALFMYSLETLLPLLDGGKTHSHNHDHSHTAKYTVRDDDTVDVSPCRSAEENKELNKMLNDSKVEKDSTLTPVAFMVVLGDGLHNLTDGMAIGAAFAAGM